MAITTRNASPETRKSRLSLTGWRDRHSAQPASEPANDSHIANPIQAWESWLWGERNRWSVDQHRLPDDADQWLQGGAWTKRRLSKSDAAELLGLAFAAIDGSGQ